MQLGLSNLKCLPKHVVVVGFTENYEDYGMKPYAETYNTMALIKELRNYSDVRPERDWSLYEWVEAVWSETTNVYTVEEYEAEKSEEMRRKLESEAARIARSHNVKFDTIEFINIINEMIEATHSNQQGMEEDGLCIGYGCTTEAWFDDYNYISSQRNNLHDIFEWLSQECPLLWAKYNESKLKEQENAKR